MIGDRNLSPGSLVLSRAIALALPAVLLLYYALRGGSYDSVVWQEEAVAIWWVLALGFAVGLLPRGSLPRLALVPLALFGLLTAWTAAALAWTDSAERTLMEVARVAHYGGVLLIAWSLLERRTRAAAGRGIAVAGVAVCALAVASRLFPGPFPDSLVDEVFGGIDRLSYPLNYWNALAAWAAMSIALTLALGAHAARAWERAAFLAAAPLCGLTVYLTYSRGGVIATAVGVGVVLLLSRNRWVAAVHMAVAAIATAAAILVVRQYPAVATVTGGEGVADGAGVVTGVLLAGALLCALAAFGTWVARGDQRWRLSPRAGRIAAAVTVVLAVAIAVPFTGDSALRAWDEFTDPAVTAREREDDPAARLTGVGGIRYPYWTAALGAGRSAPGTGIGPGTYEFWWNRTGGEDFVRDAHSVYLEQFAEAGIPGLLLIIALVASLLVAALLARSRWEDRGTLGIAVGGTAAFAVWAVHAGVDWLWEVPAVTVFAIACVAVATAPDRGRTRPPRMIARLAVVAVAVVAILLQLPGLVSTSRVRDSQAAFRAGDVAAAEAAVTDAVEAQPWAASPYVQRALLAESAGRLADAARNAQLAIAREPTNWRHRLLLARIQAERGNRGRALAAYRDARELRPESELLDPSPPASAAEPPAPSP